MLFGFKRQISLVEHREDEEKILSYSLRLSYQCLKNVLTCNCVLLNLCQNLFSRECLASDIHRFFYFTLLNYR
jgi:hypothetical protein